jgi:hypothetical protein
MTMSLQDWLNEGRLRPHKTSNSEIRQLLAVFQRDIDDSKSKAISLDRRFATAYNAALTAASTSLAASGYRTTGEGHHYVTIQSLAFTLNLDDETIEKFNRFRRKRNITDYERTGAVSELEVVEMLELATFLRTMLKTWLEKTHPELI